MLHGPQRRPVPDLERSAHRLPHIIFAFVIIKIINWEGRPVPGLEHRAHRLPYNYFCLCVRYVAEGRPVPDTCRRLIVIIMIVYPSGVPASCGSRRVMRQQARHAACPCHAAAG